MATLFDFLKETFDGVGCANVPPVFLWELIKDKAFVQIAAERVAGGGINACVLCQEGLGGLLRFFEIVLIKNSA